MPTAIVSITIALALTAYAVARLRTGPARKTRQETQGAISFTPLKTFPTWDRFTAELTTLLPILPPVRAQNGTPLGIWQPSHQPTHGADYYLMLAIEAHALGNEYPQVRDEWGATGLRYLECYRDLQVAH